MRRVGIAIVGALALATVASGASTSTPGVTASEVVIGGTIPLTGVASSYRTVGLGAAAYFRYVNAHGGVINARPIDEPTGSIRHKSHASKSARFRNGRARPVTT